jgi:outer membrane lipoprotein-sorting protein
MKRLAGFLAVLVLVLFCLGLAGCGGKKETGGQPAPGKPAKEESLAGLLAKGQKITKEGMSYEYVLTTAAGKMAGKVWLQDKKMKIEGVTSGLKVITIIDGDAGTAYAYYPAQNMAMKVSAQGLGAQTNSPTDYTKNADPARIKVLGTTVYDGVRCRVILVKDAASGIETKMWVREDYGIPVRVETTTPDGAQVVMEYKNVKIGPQPPDTFKLPAGVKITDVNAMMKQLPQVPGR